MNWSIKCFTCSKLVMSVFLLPAFCTVQLQFLWLASLTVILPANISFSMLKHRIKCEYELTFVSLKLQPHSQQSQFPTKQSKILLIETLKTILVSVLTLLVTKLQPYFICIIRYALLQCLTLYTELRMWNMGSEKCLQQR